MSEHWPAEWDDPEDENLTGDDLDGENLAEVTAALASLPLPALPEAFEARISAAISAEAATREGSSGATGGAATVRSSFAEGSSPGAAGRGATTAPRASLRRAAGSRGTRRSRAAGPAGSRPPGRGQRVFLAAGSLMACLVLAGFGYLIFGRGTTSGSTYSSALAPEAAASASASAFHAASGAIRSQTAAPAGGLRQNGLGPDSRFLVRETGTKYQPATLAGQARAAAGGGSPPGSLPGASAGASSAASASTGGLPPSAALAACVYHLTGNRTPSLVDRATYAGRAAYIIVVPRRAWVVGLGCTAASPELVTSVALAGLSGNLRALGSVERRAILRKGACSDRRT